MEPRQGTGTTSTESADMRAELLRRIGLPEAATDTDVAAARSAAHRLLESAPDAQREWAADQLAEIDAVVSLLADVPAPVAAPSTAKAKSAPVTQDAAPAVTGRRRIPWPVWVLGGAVLVAAGFLIQHAIANPSVPGITGKPDTSASSTAPAIDQARVNALMQQITSKPKDTAPLIELAAMYFQAGDYTDSAFFSQKVLAIDPKQDGSWLALGAAQFNSGDTAAAEKSWLKAIALNPDNAEAHYDLGFLYMSSKTPDMAKVKAEWSQVVRIDPTSDLAKSVKTHLDGFASASASPTPSK